MFGKSGERIGNCPSAQVIFADRAKREELIRRGKERGHRFTGKTLRKLISLLDEFGQYDVLDC